MAWLDYVWETGHGGNVEHIAEHGLTPDDIEYAMEHCTLDDFSRSSGRPIRFGFALDGRYIAVVYEWIDDATVYPITAYVLEE